MQKFIKNKPFMNLWYTNSFYLYIDCSTPCKNKHVRKSIVNKYREGNVKRTQNKENEIDLETEYL